MPKEDILRKIISKFENMTLQDVVKDVVENGTYDIILEELLDDIQEIDPTIDIREGTPHHLMASASAAKWAQVYIQVAAIFNLGFADTSEGEWLEKRTKELGVNKNRASAAVRRATFNVPVRVNERFFVEGLYYFVSRSGTDAQVTCETTGEAGNRPSGEMLPLNNINGLTMAELGDVLIPGVDDETDDTLYYRYQDRVQNPKTTGSANASLYKEWAEEVTGVGAAKVIPLWNGDNTVKIVIVDSTMSPASNELVSQVQNQIDPGSTGLGDGRDGIGSFVTVVSATGKPINISFKPQLSSGADLESLINYIEEETKNYYRELIRDNETIIRYNVIYNIVFNAPGVVDFSDLLINEGTSNIEFDNDEEIPVWGEVSIIEQ